MGNTGGGRNVEGRLQALEHQQGRVEKLLEEIRDGLIGSPDGSDVGLRGRVARLEDRLQLAAAVAWAAFVASMGAAAKLAGDWLAGGGGHR